MENRVLRFKHKETVYIVSPHDITAGRLRQFKAWFGKDYGAYLPFLQMVGQLDADAIACAMWTARRKAGDAACPDAHMLDFTMEDLLPLFDDSELREDEVEEERPTEPEAPDTPTPDSATTA